MQSAVLPPLVIRDQNTRAGCFTAQLVSVSQSGQQIYDVSGEIFGGTGGQRDQLEIDLAPSHHLGHLPPLRSGWDPVIFILRISWPQSCGANQTLGQALALTLILAKISEDLIMEIH